METISPRYFFLLLLFLSPDFTLSDNDYLNVYGEALQRCSVPLEALTGATRTGYCIEASDETGPNHICMKVASSSSSKSASFCNITNQNFCDSYMPCDSYQGQNCPVNNWCVSQVEYASYLKKAGGCNFTQELKCESINANAIFAYQQEGNSKSLMALSCILKFCDVDLSALEKKDEKSALLATYFFLFFGSITFLLFTAQVLRDRSKSKERKRRLLANRQANNVIL